MTEETCEYGGDCESRADYRMTRTNALGTTTYVVCFDHREPMTLYLAGYVSGWGAVTFTVARLEVSA